jgi:outer membrane protein assembly factor BamB
MSLCAVLLPGCTGKAVTESPPPKIEKPKPPTAVPMWLGNAERNFYGTGPWKDGELEILWEFKTSSTSGRLHKDPWGGTSWPGQPSVEGDHVYFPSADGNTYCLDKNDGSVIWKFKAKDSFKATPVILTTRPGQRADHHLYCINPKDGSLIWDFEAGFEING